MSEAANKEERYFRKFSKAVDQNDEKNISTLIQKPGILEIISHDSKPFYSFLHIVAERGTVKTAQQILNLGGCVDIYSNYLRETPLFYAVRNSAEMVNFFVENGANVNSRNHRYETPLHYAVRHSALEAVEILLKSNATVFLSTKSANVLQEALYSSSQEIVRALVNAVLPKTEQVESTDKTIKILLKKKETFYIRLEDCPTLILFAAKFGSKKRFNRVLQHCENLIEGNCKGINFKGPEDRTALHYAVREQLPEVVRFLLENGANVNCKTKNKYTPLHCAARLGNEEICRILLSFGAEVDSFSKPIGTPLYQLCRQVSQVSSGHYNLQENIRKVPLAKLNTNLMKLLLENGSDPNLKTHYGRPLFHDFCIYGNQEAVELLIQFGVNLNSTDGKGNSALHLVAKNHMMDIANLLLDKGADVNSKNFENRTPLMEVFSKKSYRYSDIIELLVYRGADINARDKIGMTILHSIVASVGLEDCVECLLALGADAKLKHRLHNVGTRFIRRKTLATGQKTVIAFLALNETQLGNYINSYINDKEEMLSSTYEFFTKSRLEVENLKSRKIVQERSVSFHDFLTCGYVKAVRFLKNDAILKMLESRKYYKEFPCYGFLIERRFERVLELKDAVIEMERLLQNCLPFIPAVIINEILAFLDYLDIRYFTRNLESAKLTEES